MAAFHQYLTTETFILKAFSYICNLQNKLKNEKDPNCTRCHYYVSIM